MLLLFRARSNAASGSEQAWIATVSVITRSVPLFMSSHELFDVTAEKAGGGQRDGAGRRCIIADEGH